MRRIDPDTYNLIVRNEGRLLLKYGGIHLVDVFSQAIGRRIFIVHIPDQVIYELDINIGYNLLAINSVSKDKKAVMANLYETYLMCLKEEDKTKKEKRIEDKGEIDG